MSLSSAEIKRQILMSAKDSIQRKRMEHPPGITEGELIEMGNALEKLTQTPGWIFVESYMIRRMNLVGLALAEKENPDQKGIARGFIELMQWIQLAVEKKNQILQEEKFKHEAQNVSKDETE